jgi:hypothetical protein
MCKKICQISVRCDTWGCPSSLSWAMSFGAVGGDPRPWGEDADDVEEMEDDRKCDASSYRFYGLTRVSPESPFG